MAFDCTLAVVVGKSETPSIVAPMGRQALRNLWTHFTFEWVPVLKCEWDGTTTAGICRNKSLWFLVFDARVAGAGSLNGYDNKPPKVTCSWFIALLPGQEFN